MFHTIVVGVDGSTYAQAALDTAIGIARSSGAAIHLVTADDPLIGEDVQRARAALPAEFRDVFDPHAAAHERLDEAASAVRLAGLPTESHYVVAHPADALLDTAEEVGADLIVVGCRGRGFAKRHLLGSVSTRLAHHTHHSILIVHSDHADVS